jgi:hypothetical protein
MTRRARQYEKSLGLGAGTIEVNIPNIERLRGNLTDTVTMIVGHQYPWLFANVAGAVALRLLGILTAWPALAVVVLVGLLRSTVSVALVFLMVQLKPDKAFSIRDHG